MTDLYDIRVLALDVSRRYVQLRAIVVYYDTDPPYADPPDDPSFFFRLLTDTARQGTPLGDLITREEIHDEDWADANTRWFVERVERVATRNHPFTDEDHERMCELSGRTRKGGLHREDLHMSADYDVVVTDPRWIEHLQLGDYWSTASYPTRADQIRAGEGADVPDLRTTAAVLALFGDGEDHMLAFSDDGRYLAACSKDGELVIVDATDWRERLRVHPEGYFAPVPMWVPGQHVINLHDCIKDTLPQLSYDVVSGSGTQAPAQMGVVRSATGRYRVDLDYGTSITVHDDAGAKRTIPVGDPELEDGVNTVRSVVFTADERLMFAARGATIFAMDPSDGRIVATIDDDGQNVEALCASPRGDYLAVLNENWCHAVSIRRVDDHQIVTRRAIGRRPGNTEPLDLRWSPDGRWLAINLLAIDEDQRRTEIHIIPIGLPTNPPAKYGLPPIRP
ncbi:WD40 repeat domain-containing protein [Streptosporangium canum]|uniref:WD40 repeat domain-containing protein n=1 Tax=Streptosporangium canum TaxID=324952 RepID=UPI0033AF4135